MRKNDSRELLRDALQRALQDAHFRPSKLDALMEQYPFLCSKERGALVHLTNWEADEPMRRTNPRFAEFSRQRLVSFLSALS